MEWIWTQLNGYETSRGFYRTRPINSHLDPPHINTLTFSYICYNYVNFILMLLYIY